MTNKQITTSLTNLQAQLKDATARLQLDRDRVELRNLEAKIQSPDFWKDNSEAEQISAQAGDLHKHIDSWDNLVEEVSTLLELAHLSGEDSNELTSQYLAVEKLFNLKMNELLYSGEYDNHDAIMQFSAGVGGTDAADWAQMLLHMYVKFAARTGLTAQIVDTSDNEEAGIKSATLEVSGRHAYGKLKGEKGVHRLVRLSPFNSDSLRQTSFALVDVIPNIPQAEAQLDSKDLKIDTFRASGHGGQSVNTTDSAVRVTHLPSGIVVSIQNERSQLKNKQKALSILASKLADLAREKHLDSIADIRGKQKSADWGAQIRSYVLHPYTKVKDHRTDFETSDATAVLAGKLDDFIEAYLKSQVDKAEL